jgi:hypothetical protein
MKLLKAIMAKGNNYIQGMQNTFLLRKKRAICPKLKQLMGPKICKTKCKWAFKL